MRMPLAVHGINEEQQTFESLRLTVGNVVYEIAGIVVRHLNELLGKKMSDDDNKRSLRALRIRHDGKKDDSLALDTSNYLQKHAK